MKSRNPIIEFDDLQMYFGEPYVIDIESAKGKLTIYSPTIGDIVELGESKFYSSLSIFTTNTTSYRLPLWEMGLDWNQISDFELFVMIYKQVDSDSMKLLFGDFDFNSLMLKTIYEDDKPKPLLYNDDCEINEEVYFHISQYLRNMFNIHPEEKLTSDKTLKNWYINKDKRQKHIDSEKEEKGEKSSHSIKTIISACINHPGFKYNLRQLKEVGVCEFYDSVQRLQIYENTTALLKGMYSGMVDSKKIKPEAYDFMKEIK